MKIYITLIGLFLLCGCQNNRENQPFYVGTYTNGMSEGIYKYLLKADGSLEKVGLAAKTDNPSYLAKSADKRYLLAVNELNSEAGTGTVESYLISGDTLLFLNCSSSGGADPCFISINKFGYIMTANYNGGNVGLLRLNKNGQLSPLLDLQQHTGKGTTDRQKEAHAHSAWFVPKGNGVISADLGSNELWFATLDTVEKKLFPSEQEKLAMVDGAGPRHLAFHPNGKWIYVINELNSTVSLVKKSNDEKYKLDSSYSTLPLDFTGTNLCADIHISRDGKFIYASNRGHNSIAIYTVNTVDGSLKLIATESTHGKWPRNFSLSPDEDYLLAANQNSNNIVSFKRDKVTGLLTFVMQLESPSPVCILF